MNDQADKQNDQVEPLLRRWGAQEASEQSEVPSMQFRIPARIGPWAMAWRWSPLLAASILLAVAIGLFIGRPNQQNISADAGLEVRLTELANDLEASRDALAEARRQLSAQTKQSEEQIAQLSQSNQKLLAEAQKQTAALKLAATEKEALRNRMAVNHKEHEKQIAQLTEGLTEARQQLETLREEFAVENALLSQRQGEAVLAQREAQEKLKAVQGRQTEILALFQRTYLASAPVSGKGLQVRQEASRRGQLINRGILLREAVQTQRSQRLFDTLEVVLTRLEMLDVQSNSERRSFARLLRTTDLMGQINEILVDWEEPSAARAWLIETQVLLMGAEHAG